MKQNPRASDVTLPYGRQDIDEHDIAAVIEVLQSDWLTMGPSVYRFEEGVARRAGVADGVAVANGTAALHCAYVAAGLSGGDEVIVPSLTFAASANAVLMARSRRDGNSGSTGLES